MADEVLLANLETYRDALRRESGKASAAQAKLINDAIREIRGLAFAVASYQEAIMQRQRGVAEVKALIEGDPGFLEHAENSEKLDVLKHKLSRFHRKKERKIVNRQIRHDEEIKGLKNTIKHLVDDNDRLARIISGL